MDDDFGWELYYADDNNPYNVMSQTGFVIRYDGCPIEWFRKFNKKSLCQKLKQNTWLCHNKS